jgi:glyoxylase I family protein
VNLVGPVHHVSLNVIDADEAGRFYEDVLGFRPIPRPDFGFPGAWFDAGGIQVHLIEVAERPASEGQHFALRVADVDAEHARLVEQGVDASTPHSFPGAGRQSFLTDPSGNLIELNQPDG